MSRIGPRMKDVQWFVARNPGRAMMHAAKWVGPNGSLRFGYGTVHRALKAGLVSAKPGPRGSTLLYPADAWNAERVGAQAKVKKP